MPHPVFVPCKSPLADALKASVECRVLEFIRDEESPAVALFSPEHRAQSCAGDWYGEHVGKWLRTASLAFARTADPRIHDAMVRVVGALARWQEDDGYLGTYASDAPCRFTSPDASKGRTWDLWVHANLILGLLECPLPEALPMAQRIGELIVATFRGGRSPVEQGNHAGLSSTVLLEPLARLYSATGNRCYLDLAGRIVGDAERRGLPLRSTEHDPSAVGTGKAYQLLWTLTGLAAYGEAAADHDALDACAAYWQKVYDHHLTPWGGPWGGVATHKEVFNAPDFFSPYGMVETCSSMAWMCFSHEMLQITGESKYAEAIERTLLNAILGARDENGRDWAYFTFPNGPRHNTYHWACCRSSGALALELGTRFATSGLTLNYLLHGTLGPIEISPQGIRYRGLERELALELRVPSYLTQTSLVIGGERRAVTPGSTVELSRTWKDGDSVLIEGAVIPRYEARSQTLDHHGQEVFRLDYVAYSHGPYSLACELEDGDLAEHTVRLPRLDPLGPVRQDENGFLLAVAGERPIRLRRFAELGRASGSWRKTWLQVAWQ